MSVTGPLSGVVIADLSRILAGPYCTLLLAEMGARVIKIETPGTGDDSRHYGPFVNGKSAYFVSVNRGKESIALDLKKPEDKATFEALLGKVDVLVENFRPGTMEKLGFGWERLKTLYPRLIYAAASGFGHSGPYSQHPAYDMVVQGLGGIMSINGHPGQPPARVGVSVGDLGAGLYTAVAINAALYHRAMTGEARKVDIGMLDCQISLLENAVVRYNTTGKVPGPLGARHPSITPFEPYQTLDGLLIIAGGNDSLFVKIAAALGLEALPGDPRFTTNDLRSQNAEALKVVLESVLRTRTMDHWVAVLEAAGVPCGPINTIDRALQHPQVAARNMLVTVDDPVTGPIKVAGNPLKIEGFPDPTTRAAAPELDGDRAKILAELGLV
ncbi:MAG TPA: CaiB/BaiF CoA-transferase family protein [Aliidongia sp.]|uniref:CaiB/BaiF CoA transferase family protein n=1 Tax=Aliidongia sp. TaxID=1914230 RepID=UPI002DDD8050|nr:CaiB/BaiF CoA-transferase family protein [Aliidongia sp.]HEV2676893.1 CaiB/BaiF CoA-transferase family protein [Aliidongia sp.]